jgi:Ca-activated chloride channel family protein
VTFFGVSFAEPLILLGLVLLPLIMLLERWSRKRRARYAVAFSNLELLRSVATPTTSWRRFLRMGLLLAALGALILGLARPQVETTVAKKRASVMLVMDTSGSMVAADVPPSRIAAATKAASDFVNRLPSQFEVGLVPFDSTASVAVAPTRDRAPVRSALAHLEANGGTAIGDGINLALQVTGQGTSTASGSTGPKNPSGRVLLLLSDGANTDGSDPMDAARRAKALGVRIYTISFGTPYGTVDLGGLGNSTPVPPDPATLQAVARETGGQFFSAADSNTLKRVYDKIGTRVGSQRQHQDVSYDFAAAGAALLALAGILAVWSRSVLT